MSEKQKKRQPRNTGPEKWEAEIIMLRKRIAYIRAPKPRGLAKEPTDGQLGRLAALEARLKEYKASSEYAAKLAAEEAEHAAAKAAAEADIAAEELEHAEPEFSADSDAVDEMEAEEALSSSMPSGVLL